MGGRNPPKYDSYGAPHVEQGVWGMNPPRGTGGMGDESPTWGMGDEIPQGDESPRIVSIYRIISNPFFALVVSFNHGNAVRPWPLFK